MPRRPLTRLLALLLAGLLLATACGSDDAEPVATEPAAEPAADEAAEDEAMDDESMDDEEAMDDEAMADDAMADAFPVTVTTGSGAATIDAQPQRIVSLSPTHTEMLFAVGAGDQVIAVDDFSNYPPEAPMTDLSGFTPNVEAIGGFEPDLVVVSFPVEGIEALGVPVLVMDAATSIDDVYTQIEQVGAATGHVGTAAEVVLGMQTEIAEIIAEAPQADLTYFHELGTELYTATSATFIGNVYSLFGLTNIADPSDADGSSFGFPQLSEEIIVEADPDLIFLADTIGYGQTAALVGERPGWENLSAVQNGGVIELNDDIASRWGPRIVELIRTVGDAIAATAPVG